MGIAGWDIGGAHLKVALRDGRGRIVKVKQEPCPLWQGMSHLDNALANCKLALGSDPEMHVVTMTAELCDIFPDRYSGVQLVAKRFAAAVPSATVRFFAGQGGFVAIDQVHARHQHIASANWAATAAFVATRVPDAIVMDIGSTTTDIIRVAGGEVQTAGDTDAQRLGSGELVYTGVVRTPLMALAGTVSLQGVPQGLANELFATTADVYRLTGELTAAADQAATADGRGKTPRESAARVARMLARDVQEVPMHVWLAVAGSFREAQRILLQQALDRMVDRCPRPPLLVGAGCGSFLVRELAARGALDYVAFADLVESVDAPGELIDMCAPAVALTHLVPPAARS